MVEGKYRMMGESAAIAHVMLINENLLLTKRQLKKAYCFYL